MIISINKMYLGISNTISWQKLRKLGSKRGHPQHEKRLANIIFNGERLEDFFLKIKTIKDANFS